MGGPTCLHPGVDFHRSARYTRGLQFNRSDFYCFSSFSVALGHGDGIAINFSGAEDMKGCLVFWTDHPIFLTPPSEMKGFYFPSMLYDFGTNR